MFTLNELRILQDLVFRVTDECDFEYQDEDYQQIMTELEAKISNLRLKETLNNEK